MLEQILNNIHNYFEREIISGTFTILSGHINVSFLQNNQYFRIVGSLFNDGVYKYPVDNLIDETFTGEIWSMAIPPIFINLVSEIEQWVNEYRSVINSPFKSESKADYNYSKDSSANGKPITWETQFASQLNHWRKIA